MKREELSELMSFLTVADERSFTLAAAKLGTSQSALSHTINRLEERLGLRLLMRSTRSVAPTDAGERLAKTLRPAFADIDATLIDLTAMRDKPAGLVRINTSEQAAKRLIMPVLERLLADYPDVQVELEIEPGLVDIVAERFDAGVRLGEQVARDMIAVRIGPDMRMAAVASPAYLAEHTSPRTPHDLSRHACLNLRMATRGDLYAWEFEKDGRELKVRVDGPLTFNRSTFAVEAACKGLGVAFVPDDHVEDELADGRLVRLLGDWCPPFSGYHLYYPSRKRHAPAFALVLDALRWKGGDRGT